jgi:hypothetical protein
MSTGVRTTKNRPYAGTTEYDSWQPAYRYGFESAQRYPNKAWQDVEGDLRSGWERSELRRDARTTWEQVKGAVRDAWDRIVGNRA